LNKEFCPDCRIKGECEDARRIAEEMKKKAKGLEYTSID